MKTTNLDIKSLKKNLIKLRDDLLKVEQTGEEAAQTVEFVQSRVGRLSRMGALQAQSMSVETKRRWTLKIQRIDSALQRMVNGKFGSCIRCKKEIPAGRLEFDATILLCVLCANKK